MDLETLCQKGPEKIKKLPTPEMFKETMESLGISDKDEVVLYDSQGIYSSARAWFMFRVFNKDVKIHVMNGGLIRWETEKYPIESGKGVSVNKSSFSLKTDTSLVYTTEEMKQRVKEYKSGLLSVPPLMLEESVASTVRAVFPSRTSLGDIFRVASTSPSTTSPTPITTT